MSQLTPQQEKALAIFKESLHLPNGGFHTLIIELSKEYQLPFQKVRSAFIKSQKTIEMKIRKNFDDLVEDELSKENWIRLIHTELNTLAQSNKSIFDILNNNENYKKALAASKAPIVSEHMRDAILEDLFLAYEKVIFKPLLAMLHTSPLYWKLMRFEELHLMTKDNRQLFEGYPLYMDGAEHLFKLDQKIRAIPLS